MEKFWKKTVEFVKDCSKELKHVCVGILIGAILGGFLVYQHTKPKDPMIAGQVPGAETADVVLNQGVFSHTAAEFEDVILGKARENTELIVMEQPITMATTITRAVLGNLAIFSKMKNVTFHANGLYTVDLSEITRSNIKVDQNARMVILQIPHAVLHSVNLDVDSMEFEDTERGLLAFGEIKLTAEEQNSLESAAVKSMTERLSSEASMADADKMAILKVYEIMEPIVTTVASNYHITVIFQ